VASGGKVAACQSAWAAARLVTSGGLQLLQFGKPANPTDARNAGLADERSEGAAASQPSAPSSKATIAFGETAGDAGQGSRGPWRRHRGRAGRGAGWSGKGSGRRVVAAPGSGLRNGMKEPSQYRPRVDRTRRPPTTSEFLHPPANGGHPIGHRPPRLRGRLSRQLLAAPTTTPRCASGSPITRASSSTSSRPRRRS